MRHLPLSSRKRMPWKNGGGETIEIAVHPPGAGLGDFDWRVSMARVSGEGPFSAFPGIERTLCILDGEGVALQLEGAGERRLVPDSPPLAFAADAPAFARLLGGPVVDLNVMTRRGVVRHRVRRAEPAGRTALALRARWTVLVASAACRIASAGGTIDLAARDAVLVEGARDVSAEPSAGGPLQLYVIEIDEADRR